MLLPWIGRTESIDWLFMTKILMCPLQKVSLYKKIYVIYSFFFVRKVVAHINTFMFYCIVLPATVVVPEVVVPKWGAVYIPSIITLLNAVGTPRSSFFSIFPPLLYNLFIFYIFIEQVSLLILWEMTMGKIPTLHLSSLLSSFTLPEPLDQPYISPLLYNLFAYTIKSHKQK